MTNTVNISSEQVAADPKMVLREVVDGLSTFTKKALAKRWDRKNRPKDEIALDRLGKSGHSEGTMGSLQYAHGLVVEDLRPEGKKQDIAPSRETRLHVEAVVLGNREAWDRLMAHLVR